MAEPWLIRFFACNREMQPFSFFLVGYSLWGGGGGISGRVRALNLTVPLGSGRVGSDNLGYGPGSGFSFEPVQNSISETSCFPLMKSWRAPCIQIICWMNNVIFHWLITINIYVKNICALFRVKCEEWQVGCHRLYFLLADYTGVIFNLTSRNITWFYYCNQYFILKIWH